MEQRQRSSQQILDLADYLLIHSNAEIIGRYNFTDSFPSDDIPLWLELSDPRGFRFYFENSEFENVMLFWSTFNTPSNFEDIKEFCRGKTEKGKKWEWSTDKNIRGSEATVTILYDLDAFDYEQLTRAKQNLIIVTICGRNKRYFLFLLICFALYKIVDTCLQCTLSRLRKHHKGNPRSQEV